MSPARRSAPVEGSSGSCPAWTASVPNARSARAWWTAELCWPATIGRAPAHLSARPGSRPTKGTPRAARDEIRAHAVHPFADDDDRLGRQPDPVDVGGKTLTVPLGHIRLDDEAAHAPTLCRGPALRNRGFPTISRNGPRKRGAHRSPLASDRLAPGSGPIGTARTAGRGRGDVGRMAAGHAPRTGPALGDCPRAGVP